MELKLIDKLKKKARKEYLSFSKFKINLHISNENYFPFSLGLIYPFNNKLPISDNLTKTFLLLSLISTNLNSFNPLYLKLPLIWYDNRERDIPTFLLSRTQ